MTLRAGVIGLGTMGRRHVRILRNLDGVILAGIADPAADPHLALSDIPIVATIEQLLERRLDYCVVATPASTHAALAIQLAQARIATLIEKPLATTLDDAAEVETAFARAGTLAAVGHIERYSPSVQALRTHLSAGALGRIYQVATRRQGPCPSRVTDVGVILDLATHDIDSVTYATGLALNSVTAHTARCAGHRHEDLVVAIGVLGNDTVSSHLVNWLSPIKERLTIVTGEQGCLVADTLHGSLAYYANECAPDPSPTQGVIASAGTRYNIAKIDPLLTEHQAFRDAVLGDQSRIVTLAEGIATIAVARAMLTSAQHAAEDINQDALTSSPVRRLPDICRPARGA